ncbi:hypothetical protein NKH77_19440 [Streptomyces sp. M19]
MFRAVGDRHGRRRRAGRGPGSGDPGPGVSLASFAEAARALNQAPTAPGEAREPVVSRMRAPGSDALPYALQLGRVPRPVLAPWGEVTAEAVALAAVLALLLPLVPLPGRGTTRTPRVWAGFLRPVAPLVGGSRLSAAQNEKMYDAAVAKIDQQNAEAEAQAARGAEVRTVVHIGADVRGAGWSRSTTAPSPNCAASRWPSSG